MGLEVAGWRCRLRQRKEQKQCEMCVIILLRIIILFLTLHYINFAVVTLTLGFAFVMFQPQIMVVTTSFLKAAAPADTVQCHFILMYDQPPVASYCAIESLRRVSGAKIIVWINAFTQLPSYIPENTDIRTLNLTNKFHGTPFQNLEFNGTFGRQNIANALRLSVVYKYGGMYMDSNFIVRRSPDDIVDGMGLASETVYNNAAFKFKRPLAPFLDVCMHDFVDKYNGSMWGNQGPTLFMRVQYACKQKEATGEPANCPSTWPKESFYPINQKHRSIFWGTINLELNSSIALQLWNAMTKHKEKELCGVPEEYNSRRRRRRRSRRRRIR